MKKILSIILVLTFVFGLAACGSGGGDAPNESGSEATRDTQDTQPTESAEELPEFQQTAAIEETVLVNESGIVITATALEYGNSSADVRLTLENNSDRNLSFTCNTVGYSCNSVNGYMIEDGYISCDVTAGSKANETVSFSYDALMLYGIFEIADIELGFRVTDDDYNEVFVGNGQLRTSIADQYDYAAQSYSDTISGNAAQAHFGYTLPYFSDEALLDQDGFTVASQAFITNTDGETALFLEVVNASGQTAIVSAEDISVNGLGVYSGTWSSDTISTGKTGIININLSDLINELFTESLGIEEFGEISMTLGFKNAAGEEISPDAVITVTNPDASATFNSDGEEVYNAGDVRIVMKEMVKDDSEYGGDIYLLLLAENNSAGAIDIMKVYDSMSINGYMMDFTMYSASIGSGNSSLIEIQLWESDLEENSIAEVSDITQLQFGLEIWPESGDKTEATIAIEF